MSGRAGVDGAAPPLAGLGLGVILRHVRCHAEPAQCRHVISGVIGAILAAAILLGAQAIEDWVTALIAMAGLVVLLLFQIDDPPLLGIAAAIDLVVFKFVSTKQAKF